MNDLGKQTERQGDFVHERLHGRQNSTKSLAGESEHIRINEQSAMTYYLLGKQYSQSNNERR